MDFLESEPKTPEKELVVTENLVFKGKFIYGNIDNNFIFNWIKDNNTYALKLALYLSKTDIATSVERNGKLVQINLDLDDFLDFCNVNIRTLTDNIHILKKTEINRVTENEMEFWSLIPYLKIDRKNNRIELDMYHNVFMLLKACSANFTNINLENIMKFKNKHTIRMLLLLSHLNDYSSIFSKSKNMSLENLNTFFDTDYKKIHDFHKKVIIPVKEDLEENNSFLQFKSEFGYLDKHSKGRASISHIKVIALNKKVIHELKSTFENRIRETYINHRIITERNTVISINEEGDFIDIDSKQKLANQDKIWEYLYSHQNEIFKISNAK